MPQVFTPLAFAAALRAVGPDINRRIANAMGAGLSRAERFAAEDFASKGVGKAIFYGGPRDVLKQGAIRRTKIAISGGRITGSLVAQGFAALQEGGGRTKPHIIEPKNRRMLAFGVKGGFGFGGDMVFARRVNHPGSRVARFPFMQAAIDKARIPEAIEREATQFLSARLG